VNQPIASTQVPIIDNLYLDMNGIIHNCTHGNNPDVKLTEEEMVLQIFAYVERLFQIIQPQKLLFAAIDGGALPVLLGSMLPGLWVGEGGRGGLQIFN